MGSESDSRVSAIVEALDSAVIAVRTGTDQEREFTSVTVLDTFDLQPPQQDVSGGELFFLIGARTEEVLEWLWWFDAHPNEPRPAAFLVKEALDLPSVQEAAAKIDLTMIVIDRLARWDVMLTLAIARLERDRRAMAPGFSDGRSPDIRDLFGLAEVVAKHTGGLVSIEDSTEQRLLAYSPSTTEADDWRTRTILGRGPSPQALQLLRKAGVIGALRSSQKVVQVAGYPEYGIQSRLAVGIHGPGNFYLGSIWVQQGAAGFLPEAESVVLGASVTAAQILARELNTPSSTEEVLYRILGEKSEIDAATAAAYLGVPADSLCAIVAIASTSENEHTVSAIAQLLLLHARAFSPDAVVALIRGRAYILFPSVRFQAPLQPWTEQLLNRFDNHPGLSGAALRAAVSAPIQGIGAAANARHELDLVLASSSEETPRVTTLAQSRTSVLLNQILAPLAERSELHDPRIEHLRQYDFDHGTDLLPSARAFLNAGSNVRQAAQHLNVHPNTLRYRVERVQRLTGLDFAHPGDRLLTMIQLELHSTPPTRRSETPH